MYRMNPYVFRPLVFSFLVLVATTATSTAAPREGVAHFIDGLTPTLGQTFLVEGPGPYNVPAQSSFQGVEINGWSNKAYLEVHLMELRLDDTIVDSDSGSGTVTTNQSGHWEHLAHDTGHLYGERLLGQGSHSVRASGQIAASRLDPGAPNLFDANSMDHQFFIEQIG